MPKLTIKEKKIPRWDWNLQYLNRQPARYYCRHLGLYDTDVLQRMVYLNLRAA